MLRWTRHLVSSFLCVAASWRHSESAAAAARASAQPYPTRQRTTSPDGSAAQAETSLACRPASARQVESARDWLSESSCCWYTVAARSASVCFQLCCSTRHCAAPFASIVIALHSRTSAAFRAADLPQASRASVSAAVNRALVRRVHRMMASACGVQGATKTPHTLVSRVPHVQERRRRGPLSPHATTHQQFLLLRRLRQHAPGQREECLVGRARGRQPELRAQLRVPLRRHLANRGQILEQLTLQRAPHLGALLGGPAPRQHAGPLLPRQRLRPRDQLLEAGPPRRLGALNPLRPMGQEEIPHPYGHLQPSPQYRH